MEEAKEQCKERLEAVDRRTSDLTWRRVREVTCLETLVFLYLSYVSIGHTCFAKNVTTSPLMAHANAACVIIRKLNSLE